VLLSTYHGNVIVGVHPMKEHGEAEKDQQSSAHNFKKSAYISMFFGT